MKIYNNRFQKELDFKLVVTAFNHDKKDYVLLTFDNFEDFSLTDIEMELTFVFILVSAVIDNDFICRYFPSVIIRNNEDFVEYCSNL